MGTGQRRRKIYLSTGDRRWHRAPTVRTHEQSRTQLHLQGAFLRLLSGGFQLVVRGAAVKDVCDSYHRDRVLTRMQRKRFGAKISHRPRLATHRCLYVPPSAPQPRVPNVGHTHCGSTELFCHRSMVARGCCGCGGPWLSGPLQPQPLGLLGRDGRPRSHQPFRWLEGPCTHKTPDKTSSSSRCCGRPVAIVL